MIEIFNVKKTDFYFENTNFLLKDADLILILKKKKKLSDFYFKKMQIRFFFYLKKTRFLFGKNADQIFLLITDRIFIWKKCR